MRVAIVHDDLVQWGGAERVLQGICEIYPDAPIYTSVFDQSNKELVKRFGSRKVITSFLQNIPGWKSLYKLLLPLYPIAFEQFNFDEFDLVISHTTRFAKSIITKPETKHVCYCHTPPRFLWHLSGEISYGWGELLMSKLRLFDQVSANRVDFFLAGSENAKKRIKKIYQKESRVLYPYVDLKRFNGIESFNGGYFLMIARDNKYKKVELAKRACQELGVELKVVSGGLDEKVVMQILAGCRALIIPGIEDFGIVSLEAAALGKPVIAYQAGGSLETVIEGETGLFFKEQTSSSLKQAIKRLEMTKIDPARCKEHALKFSQEVFSQNFKKLIATIV